MLRTRPSGRRWWLRPGSAVTTLTVSLIVGLGGEPASADQTVTPGSTAAAESLLVGWVPDSIVASCATGPASDALESLECSPAGPMIYRYERFADSTSLAVAFDGWVGGAGAPATLDTGDCSRGPSLVEWAIPGVSSGKLACFEVAGAMTVVWTDADLLVVGVMQGGSDYPTAYDLWLRAGPDAPPPKPTPGPQPRPVTMRAWDTNVRYGFEPDGSCQVGTDCMRVRVVTVSGCDTLYGEVQLQAADGTALGWTNDTARGLAPGQPAILDFEWFDPAVFRVEIIELTCLSG